MTETNGNPGLAAITGALQPPPLEERVPGYGGAGISAGDWVYLIADEDVSFPGERYCPRGVDGCGGSCEWQCLDCDCVNCHEAFCYRCGACAPDAPRMAPEDRETGR